MNIPVNESAPVLFRAQIIINAPVSTVWELIASINEWPGWQSDVTGSELLGDLQEGTDFVWKAGGVKYKSKIHTMVNGSEFGWTGKTLGARAIHNWRFLQKGNTTIVEVEECLQGFLPSVLKRTFQKILETGMKKNLSELKHAAEVNK